MLDFFFFGHITCKMADPIDHDAADHDPMPQWGNQQTANLNNILYTNVQLSRYYQRLREECADYPELMLEAQQSMRSLEPFIGAAVSASAGSGSVGTGPGGNGGAQASTAFCVLLRMHQLRPTRWNLRELLLDAGGESTAAYARTFALSDC